MQWLVTSSVTPTNSQSEVKSHPKSPTTPGNGSSKNMIEKAISPQYGTGLGSSASYFVVKQQQSVCYYSNLKTNTKVNNPIKTNSVFQIQINLYNLQRLMIKKTKGWFHFTFQVCDRASFVGRVSASRPYKIKVQLCLIP